MALFLAAAQPARALDVLHLRGGSYPDKTRLVLELSDIVDFKVAASAGPPPALYIDLPPHRAAPRLHQGLKPFGITGLTSPDPTRLTLTLAYPVKVLSAFMLPGNGTKPNRLVIDFRRLKTDEETDGGRAVGTLSNTGDPSGILGVLNRTLTDEEAPAPAKPDRYTIIIDAGHGGKDPGAIGVDNVREKNITLAAARELARQLTATGRYKVVMTRSTDTYLLLPERVKIARENHGDLFVSLHADMAEGASDTNGLSIYTLSDTASDAQTEKLAAAENKVDLLDGVDLRGTEKEVANILIDLAMRDNMNQSRFFAGKLVKQMDAHGIDLLPRPHRYAGFAVLKAPDIPSVLVEMGFLSNPREAKRLQDEAHRRRLMAGLVKGINIYFDYIDQTRAR